MSQSILHFIMFFGSLFIFVIAIGQFLQKKKEDIDIIYVLNFFGLAIWLFHISLYSTGIFDNFLYIYFLKIVFIPLIFLVPPIMVMRYRWIITSKFFFKRKYYLLVVPSILSLIWILLPLFFPDISISKEYLEVKTILSNEFMAMPLYFQILYSLFFIANLYLVIALLPNFSGITLIFKKDINIKNLKIIKLGYIFAFTILFANILTIIGIYFSISLIKLAVIIANLAICGVYFTTQRHPEFNKLLKKETKKANYERSKIKGLNIEQIIFRLHDIMESEKAFADEDLALGDLAAELSISLHQLSQILNEKLNKNFNLFVNEYRIKESKKLLIEEPDRTVLSISAAAGFNSITTFNTVFSKLTGISPRQYRKNFKQKNRLKKSVFNKIRR